LIVFLICQPEEIVRAASGRREDLRWKREVLEETMVSLINASFSYVDFVDLQAAEERALDAHRVQLEALTKLRLLAKPKVLELAFELHDIEDQLYSIVYKEALESAEWESAEWEKVKARWHDLQDQREKVRFERGPRAQNFPC
jgi:hypothetical protein